jgi:hypothetical protein
MTEWLAWAWVIGVDLAVIVAAVFASYDRTLLTVVRWQHVAAATIVAVMGWEGAANVVASIIGSTAFTAADIGFLAAQAIFAGAAAVALVFVLRRRRWAVVLGIGLAAVRFLLAMLALVELISFAADMEPGSFAGTAAFVVLAALPLLLAVWLFVDPFFRGQLAWRPSEPASAPEAIGDDTEPPAEPALER